MEFKKYNIREWWFGGQTTDTEYELPVLNWFKDEIGDSVQYEGSFNYVAIALKDSELEAWVESMCETICPPVSFFNLGLYYMVYMPNVLDIDGQFELTQKIRFPVSDILRFDAKDGAFVDVIRPLEYVGGGNCIAKIWSITHNGIEEPAYARRTIKISDFDIWDQFYKYSVNPSKVDLYKECVIDLIETGVCSINYNYVQDLFSKIQSIRRCQRFGMTNHSNGKDMPNDELKALLDEYRLAGCGEKVEPTIKMCV